MQTPASVATGIAWPAIPDANSSTLLAMLFQLEDSQWWPWEKIQQQQLQQLARLLAHAYKEVPFHRERLKSLAGRNFQLGDYADLSTIPVLTRDQIQLNPDALISKDIPDDHHPRMAGRSSGSTGKPVNFFHTKVTKIFGRVLDLRNQRWQQLDPTENIAFIQLLRRDIPEAEYAKQRPSDNIFPGGTFQSFNCARPVSEQLDWLVGVNPERIVTYPTNLAALTVEARNRNIELPRLKTLQTLGELVPPQLRPLCREVWGLPVIDVYSCKETNTLALQCPEHEHYHVQSERIIMEVLDKNDRPCTPGETGRVVITDLHNFAMPFIRYEVGDHAEVGEPCPCGRGLPVIRRILGRTRNMMVLPSGERVWPQISVASLSALGPVKQMQVIQKTLTDIDVSVVLSSPMDAATEATFVQAVREKIAILSRDFSVDISYVDDIPRSAGGKYEDFMCMVA